MPKQDTGLRGVLLDGRRICCRLSHFVERYRPFQTIFVQMEIGHGVVRCGRLYFLRGEFRFTRVKSRRKFYQDERENIMKKVLALLLTLIMTVSLAGCGGSGDTGGSASAEGEVKSGVEDGVLTVAMECSYAPYNWTQADDSNGAVPIKDSNEYANGYDVMMAKKICEANGWDLEIVRTDWDSLVPGVQSGIYDAVIAGQSMTEDRMQQVDFAGPYYYASIVCVTKADGPYAEATGLSDLSGATCTAQIATVWYDSMLPQIKGAKIQTAAETAPAMLMALESGTVDFVCTDMPTAMGAVAAYPDLKILDFSDSDDGFKVDEGDINIGISVMKGNTVLKDDIDSVLSGMTEDDFNAMMEDAIAIQPLSQE